jgi:hypothetical protein
MSVGVGSIGRVHHPQRGDLGRDFVVVATGNNRKGQACVKLESVERVPTSEGDRPSLVTTVLFDWFKPFVLSDR